MKKKIEFFAVDNQTALNVMSELKTFPLIVRTGSAVGSYFEYFSGRPPPPPAFRDQPYACFTR